MCTSIVVNKKKTMSGGISTSWICGQKNVETDTNGNIVAK